MGKCPHCDSAVARTKKEQSRTIASTTFLVRGVSYACKKCRVEIVFEDDVRRIDLEVASVLAMRSEPHGEGFRFLRRSLELRAIELAALLHVTAETVSRWENDQRPVDLNAWVTLGSMVLERAGHPPATLRRLLALQAPAKMPRSIRLDFTGRARTAVVA